MTDREFTISRTFDAPRELVWQAWTDPAIAGQWWHPHEMTTSAVEIDLQVGGTYSYVMTGTDGIAYPTAGTYLELQAPERMRCTWGSPQDAVDEAPILTIDLVERSDGRTDMTFQVTGAEPRIGAEDSVHDGWGEAFEELASTLRSVRR